MRTPLCTLFNFNYLDKGLALYESLERVASDFVLYVLAMDDACFDFLRGQRFPHLCPISLSEFENEALLQAKANRSFGEYCWTCSSSLIKYVLDRYEEPACAYVDADMSFYSDPAVLFQELAQRNGSVLLTGHRFNRCEQYRNRIVGRFCVEFNLFLNRQDAREALDEWISQCLEKCSAQVEEHAYGDQKYLDGWLEKYDFVRETCHYGAGVAPWNVAQYRLVSHQGTPGSYCLRTKGRKVDLVFYHFEGIAYLDRHNVDIGVYRYWGTDARFVTPLYTDYLQTVERYKAMIFQETGREILLKSHPAFEKENRGVKERIHSVLQKLSTREGLWLIWAKEIPQRLFAAKNLIRF